MIEIDREIGGAHDYELQRPRTSPLTYSATWPQEGEAPGVVLVVPGFGADATSDYSRNLRRHIVETTGFAAVSVRYHAIEARPSTGGVLEIWPREQLLLRGVLAQHGITTQLETVHQLVTEVGANFPGAKVRGSILPGKDEYQNFGIIQALDHLCVLGDLLEHAPPFDHRRIVAMGSSHGGYIAHLIAKIAPSTLAAVIDNSAYAQPPMSYLGIGDDPEVQVDLGGLWVNASTKGAWSISRREDPTFYDRDRDLIRDLRYLPHAVTARAAAPDAGTQFFMVNSVSDPVSPPDVKLRQQQVLDRAGFQAELQLVGEEDLDGRLFKTLAHGLDCSLKALFDREIGKVRPREAEPDAMQGSVISYDCVDRGYRFTHAASVPYVTLETYDLHPID